MGVRVADELRERYVWWHAGGGFSDVCRFVKYAGRLCFPIRYVGLCKPFVYGKGGVCEFVDFKLY